jgi:hypothetical protein
VGTRWEECASAADCLSRQMLRRSSSLPRETLANLSITGHLRRFLDQPVAEIVQCGEPLFLANFSTLPPQSTFCDVGCDITDFSSDAAAFATGDGGGTGPGAALCAAIVTDILEFRARVLVMSGGTERLQEAAQSPDTTLPLHRSSQSPRMAHRPTLKIEESMEPDAILIRRARTRTTRARTRWRRTADYPRDS